MTDWLLVVSGVVVALTGILVVTGTGLEQRQRVNIVHELRCDGRAWGKRASSRPEYRTSTRTRWQIYNRIQH